LTIAIPPLAEQQPIADFLDRKTAVIDELIAKKERLVALLAEKRQALITQFVTKGLDPSVPMKDSGIEWIGKVPRHWQVLPLKHLSPRISGRLVFKPAQCFVDDGVPFLMGNNITEDGVVWTNLKYVSRETNARFAHHALRAGDVVMVRVGAPGVTCVVPTEADGLNCGSMMIVRQSPMFVSNWLAATLNSHVVRTQLDLVQYGAAQEQINIGDAVGFLLPVPPVPEQHRLADALGAGAASLRDAVATVGRSVERLREYRQALITAVVTGQIDVSDERAVAAHDDEVAALGG
jgi:type I restriction enzyme S subunit